MDPVNRLHSKGTYWIIRGEHLVVLALGSVLVALHAGEVNWWRFAVAFILIDVVGYIPGAIAYGRSESKRIAPRFHYFYNLTHTYLVSGTGVAVWAYFGGFEWAMLAVPIHLSIDRGVFGNILKPAALSFEPRRHSPDVLLRTLGYSEETTEAADGIAADGIAVPSSRNGRIAAADAAAVVNHPSGYLTLSGQNRVFRLDGVTGFISYREQGKHYWLFGGVHAQGEDAGRLLDAFVAFARSNGRRAGAVQVRPTQVELFAGRGFKVNQMGSTFVLDLKQFTLAGGKKMQLRNKINKARKSGLRVVEVGHDVPRDARWFAKMREVSDEWIGEKGKKELDFMVGEIGGPEDELRRPFLVIDEQENVLAFITYVPAWGERPGYLHDLTRRRRECPPGVMELCNAEAIARFQAEGVPYLHLGFTPLIIDAEKATAGSRTIHRVMQGLRKWGRKLYPADSQAAYKEKWDVAFIEREYLAVQRVSPRMVLDLLVITRTI